MSDDDRIDLSPLDPASDRPAWDRFVGASIAKAVREADARQTWWELVDARRRAIVLVSMLAAAAGVLAMVRPATPSGADVQTLLLTTGSHDATQLLAVGGGR